MSPQRRVQIQTWLKDWGPLFAGFIGSLVGIILSIALAMGFGLMTPSDLFAAMDARLTTLEQRTDGIDDLRRYFCAKDYGTAKLFIPCDYLSGK
jgi:hypothetical protein